MRWLPRAGVVLVVLVALLPSCAPRPASEPAPAHAPLLGRVTRAQLEPLPAWREARSLAPPDPIAAHALARVPPGAVVRVFLGTWCSDSRKEVSRFWQAMDLAESTPFGVELIAVDRRKRAPDGLTDDAHVRYVPTFVVLRDGREVGRVVESSPSGIEADVGALLRGTCTGVISTRENVGARPCDPR